MKRVKQINNLVIKQDTVKYIYRNGYTFANSNYGFYRVYTPNGICLEDRLTLKEAEDFCKETLDFVKRKIK